LCRRRHAIAVAKVQIPISIPASDLSMHPLGSGLVLRGGSGQKPAVHAEDVAEAIDAP
jgi:hypothetical protein